MLLALWSAKIIRCTDEEIRWSGVARPWTYENLFLSIIMDEMLRWRGTTRDGVVRAEARKYFSGWKLKLCLVSCPFVDGGKYQLVKV